MTVLPPWNRERLAALLARRDSLAHAYLLAGQAGLGKHDAALALAQALLCEQPTPLACGNCRGCRLLASGNHPDLHVLASERRCLEQSGLLLQYAMRYVQEDSRRKNPSAIIAIDQVRALFPEVAKRPHLASCRVIVIHNTEEFNENAANSLLKVLEEPPPDTYFLLVSDDPGRLLPTIRSRAIRLDFRMPDREQALAWLGEQLGDSRVAAARLAKAQGAPLRALQLEESEDDLTTSLASLMRQLSRQEIDPVAAAEQLRKDATRPLSATLAALQRCIVDLLRTAAGGAAGQGTGLHENTNRLHSRQLFGYLDELFVARREALKAVDEGLMLESLLASWQEIHQAAETLRGRNQA